MEEKKVKKTFQKSTKLKHTENKQIKQTVKMLTPARKELKIFTEINHNRNIAVVAQIDLDEKLIILTLI